MASTFMVPSVSSKHFDLDIPLIVMLGPQGSPFSVTLDAESPRNYTAQKQFFQSQVLLYSATNLGPGKHVVKVAYEPSQPDQIFAVDFANVYTTPSTGSAP